jgi:hypothetical protein
MPMSPRTLRPRQTTHPEAAAWAARVVANGGSVGASLQAVSRFCRAIDAAGIRDRFYRLNLFCGGTSGTAAGLNACIVPLYRSTSFGGSPVGGSIDTNNGPFLPADYSETGATGGLTGNGSTKYLNTGLNANVLPDTTQSGHLSVYAAGTYSGQIAIGVYTYTTVPTFQMELQLNSAGSANTYIDGTSNVQTPTASSPQLFTASRTSSTSHIGYANATAGTTGTATASNTTPALPFFVFARNFNGGPAVHFGQTLRAYSIGLGMTGQQVSAYNTAMQTFQAALNRSV